MATAEQVKALVKSYAAGDDDRFYAVSMQVAADAAKKGHGKLAQELRQLIDEAKLKSANTPARRPVPIARTTGELAGLLHASFQRVKLSDMVLAEPIRNQLSRIVHEYRQQSKLRSHGLSARRKLLLVGPPGSGKTMTSAALAAELSMPLFGVQLHGLITKFMGETAAKLRMIFDAMVSQRGVYFFDEFDAIGADRAASNDVGEIRRVLNSFLQFLEQDDSDSLIVAATNHVKMLDPALFRRFDDVVRYELPSRQLAQELMMNRLTVFGVAKIDWNQISAIADGLSYAEIARACDDAAREVVLTDRKSVDTDLLASTLRDRLGKTQA